MTAYSPNPVVTVAGVDLSSETLNSITITGGRTSVDEQPRAAYTSINLVNHAGAAINLNDTVTVTIATSTGTTTIVTGRVTDVATTLSQYGAAGAVYQTVITCVGTLALLTRLTSTASYSAEGDGTRIDNLLTETVDAGLIGTIETPGDVTVTAKSGTGNAWSLISTVANSANGVVYETGDGLINYESTQGRTVRTDTYGYTTVPAAVIGAIGLGTSISTGSLTNDLTVTYSGGSVNDTSADSITLYGVYAAKRDTILSNVTDADAQLDHLLATRSVPRPMLSSVTVPLHNPDLATAVRDDLIGVYCGLAVELTGLPTVIRPTTFQGFVEGYRWDITRTTAVLTMFLSDAGLSAATTSWWRVNPAEAWNTLSATLTWADARSVA